MWRCESLTNTVSSVWAEEWSISAEGGARRDYEHGLKFPSAQSCVCVRTGIRNIISCHFSKLRKNNFFPNLNKFMKYSSGSSFDSCCDPFAAIMRILQNDFIMSECSYSIHIKMAEQCLDSLKVKCLNWSRYLVCMMTHTLYLVLWKQIVRSGSVPDLRWVHRTVASFPERSERVETSVAISSSSRSW